MKKLGIVLVALVLVGSSLLAALESPITAELKAGAKTEFKVDLNNLKKDNIEYGFTNDVHADLTLTFLPKQNVKYEGDGQIWAQVDIKDLKLVVKNTKFEDIYGSVKANIWFEDLLFLTVGRVDFKADEVAIGQHKGVKNVGMEGKDGLTFGVKLENVGKVYASVAKSISKKHDWKFLLAFEGDKFVDLVTPKFYAAYDLAAKNLVVATSAKTELDIFDGLAVTVKADAELGLADTSKILDNTKVEASVDTVLTLVKGAKIDGKDNNTEAGLEVAYVGLKEHSLHAKLSFTEAKGDDGFVPLFGGSISGGADVIFGQDKAGKTEVDVKPFYDAELGVQVADFDISVGAGDKHDTIANTIYGKVAVKYTGLDHITLAASYDVPNVLKFKDDAGVAAVSFAVDF